MKKELIRKANQENLAGKKLSNIELKKIVKIYQDKITIPKSGAKQVMIICPVGLVGAGKTTVMKPISKQLKLIRISSDEIRYILKQKGYNYARTIEIAKLVMIKFLNDGYNIAIDADNIDLKIQKYFNNLGRKRKINIIWVHIKPPEKFIINKLMNYKHTWLFKDAVAALNSFKRRKPLHQAYLSKIKFYYKFNTANDNLNIQINKFINKLKRDFKF